MRVYRYGCRVASDRLGPVNAHTTFQSWSMAKSVTALIFGRAMTQGLIGPDDPLGSLIPLADAAHGAITMRDLLTQTSGLQWNGLRDYDIFMPNRIQEALTVPVEKKPGTYWEYSQSGPALVAEATQNAVGEDFQAYAQRELLGPLGIEPGTWRWQRDSAGHTQGFFGVHMVPDDFARLGELMRRGGVWHGRRLLSKRFVREAVTPIAQNGCYGYFIWVNASKPCVGPRVIDRPVRDERDFPTLPADMYQFAGLFGQLVTVFPSQGLIVARFGQDSGSLAGGAPWEEQFYRQVLGSITDEPIRMPKPKPDAGRRQPRGRRPRLLRGRPAPRPGRRRRAAAAAAPGRPRARPCDADRTAQPAPRAARHGQGPAALPPRLALGPAPALRRPRAPRPARAPSATGSGRARRRPFASTCTPASATARPPPPARPDRENARPRPGTRRGGETHPDAAQALTGDDPPSGPPRS